MGAGVGPGPRLLVDGHAPGRSTPRSTPPYAIVVVELDEGPRLVGNLLGLAPAELALDLPVVGELEPVSDTVALVHFRPAP